MHFINYLDIAIIVIFLMITLMGCIVGFTGKVLSILGWGLAGAGTFYLYPFGKHFARHHIESPLLADIVAGGVIFILLLILFLVIAKLAANAVKKSPLSFLDRSLGMFLGIFLGAIFLSLMTVSLDFLMPQSQIPQVVKESKLYPFLKITANWMENRAPLACKKYIEQMAGAAHHEAKKLTYQVIQEEEKLEAELLSYEKLGDHKDTYHLIKKFAD